MFKNIETIFTFAALVLGLLSTVWGLLKAKAAHRETVHTLDTDVSKLKKDVSALQNNQRSISENVLKERIMRESLETELKNSLQDLKDDVRQLDENAQAREERHQRDLRDLTNAVSSMKASVDGLSDRQDRQEERNRHG